MLISVSAAPLRDAVGIANGSVYVVDDITERRNLEQHLQHSQKMESLGVLAGGVAHDFNNLLTGILGNASLVLDDIAEDDPNRPLLNDVVRASERAATLTRQLLAYAGKGRFVAQPIQLSKLITEMHSLLESSLPKKVHFVRDLPLDLPWMEGDPSQLQQVIMNLVLNAAEAMEEKSSGGIFVSACVVQADGEYAREYLNGEAIVSGPYVLLEVHDTGSGMDEFVQARVFDPFFSTKFTGRGLGLSAVLGIVRSHGGALRVTSQKEQGTSFRILFPVTDIFSGATEKASERNQAILVTDVEVRDQLERLGYPVVAAKSSESALQILLGMRQSLALFLLEPEGQEALLGHINRLQAPIPVILITDLKDGEALRRFHRYRPAGFLRKPYTAESLDRKLLSVLYQQEMSDQSGTST